MLESVFRLIAPHRCCSCEQKGALLCENCKNDIISETYASCLFCTKPTLAGVCSPCRRRTGYQQGWCLGERRTHLKKLGDQYKFDCKREGTVVFADLLDSLLPLLPPDIMLVSIPTTPTSVRARGFDHVGATARRFAKRRGLATGKPLLRSTAQALHFMDYSQRIELADSLFTLSGELVPKRILVMDDIVTTGTTLKSAAKLLKEAGAEELYVVAWARQPFDDGPL